MRAAASPSIFLAAPGQGDVAEVELTYNWPPADGTAAEEYSGGRNFGHLAVPGRRYLCDAASG